MAERTVSVKLQAKVDGFVSGMKVAKKSADDLTASGDKLSKKDAFGKLADKAAIAGLGVATAVGVAVKRFADFDQSMSAVQANTGATGASLEQLRDAAIKMGADSTFSAKEAADGINELGKAGVSTADIMGGALKGSMDLAAAGQIGVAQAAETTASALTQFGLAGDKATHVADLLTNGANKAQGGVGDLGQALNNVGSVANSTGLSIEETTGTLAAFASSGLVGAEAGTALKSMLLRLSNPVGKAATLMDELGISAYDASGKFVGMQSVAGQLTAALKDKTEEERNSALATIFGSFAVDAATKVYNQGSAGIAKWTSEVSEQGAAAKQAATLTDNLKGDVERLGGALDSVFISTGSGANGGLRTLTQGLTGIIEKVGQVPGPVLLAGGALTSFALLAPKGVIAYRNYTKTLDSLGISMDKLNTKAPKTGAALGAAGKAAGGVAVALVALSVANAAFADGLEKLGTEALVKDLTNLDGGLESINKRFDETSRASTALGEAETGINSLGDAIDAAFDPGKSAGIENFFGSLGSAFGIENTSKIATAKTRLAELDAALTTMVQSGNAQGAASQFAAITAEAQKQGVSVDELKAKFPQYAEALAGAGNAAATATPDVQTLAGAAGAAASATQDASDATTDWAESLSTLNSPALSAREAARALEESVDAVTDSIKENGKSLDINTAKGRANQDALDGVARAALNQISALSENGASQAELQGALGQSRVKLIAAAKQFGLSGAAANKFADEVLAIPPARAVKITTTADSARQGVELLQRRITGLNGKTVTVTTRLVTVGRAPTGGFSTAGGVTRAAGGAVFGPGTGTSDSIPARLSNGEHVLTAAEVRAAGGQGAIYALRAAIRSGSIPKFADGGAVMSASRFAAAPARQVISIAGPTGTSVATVDSASIRAMAREVATQTAREVSAALLANGRSTALKSSVGRNG